jgi:hypothetical protein
MTDCRVIRVYDPGFAEIVSDYFLNTALADRVRNAATASPRLRQNWSNSRSSYRIFNVEFSGLIPRRLCIPTIVSETRGPLWLLLSTGFPSILPI